MTATTNATTNAATAIYEAAERILFQANPRMGQYGIAVLEGRQRLSGADLRGNARRYGDCYQQSRRAVVAAARAAGGHIRRGPHGRLTLEWRSPPEGAKKARCALGECWAY